MKKLLFIVFLATILLSSCQSGRHTATITGRINSIIPCLVEYTQPIDGICYIGFKDTLRTDSTGHFRLELNTDKTCFVQFFSGLRLLGTIIIEPGKKYGLSVYPERADSVFIIKSKDAKGQNLFNSLKNTSMANGHFQSEARDFMRMTDMDSIKADILSRKENCLTDYKKLRESKEISTSFLKLVENDRECFYAGTAGSIALINSIIKGYGRNYLTESQYSELWTDVFNELPPTEPSIITSPWYFLYLENYLDYMISVADTAEANKALGNKERGQLHLNKMKYAEQKLNKETFEFYCAAYIFFEAINRNYEKSLIDIFEYFKSEYPGSKFTGYLVPYIDEIRDFHKRMESEYSRKTKFADNNDDYSTLKDCISEFAGKKIFIDVWATWCGPCKKEFEYNKQLTSILSPRGIEKIYISLDSDNNDQQWKDMIKYYNLEGYHIRAGEKLTNDLRTIFDKNGAITIPWFLLIDEKGNIVKKHASGPSRPDELEKQISELL